MSVIGLLKSAFSKVGDLDRRITYGSDYKQKAQALAQLNELKVKAALLENEDKFQRIQQMRAELARHEQQRQAGAFDSAVKFGAGLDAPSSGIMGPPDPNNPNDSAGGVLEPDLPSFVKSQLNPADQGPLQMAIRQGRQQRQKKEVQNDQLFEANLGAANLKDDVLRSLIDVREATRMQKERGLVGGGRDAYVRQSGDAFITNPDGTVTYGTKAVLSDGSVRFIPNPEGARPFSADPSQKDRDYMNAAGNSYSNLARVVANFEKANAKGLLGGGIGRMAEFSARWMGGKGLSKEDRVLMQSIDRAKTLAAFAEGGKQLTGVEKQYFDENYPTLHGTDDPETFIALAKELLKVIRAETVKRQKLMPAQRRFSDEQMGQAFTTPGVPDPLGPPASNSKDLYFDEQGNPIKK